MAEPRPFIRLPGSLSPLGYRNFGLAWLGFVASNSGRWIELTGAIWLMYELTGSPVLLGFLGVARAIPTILLGPIGGVIADRVDQRKLLLVTQGLAFIVSLCLGLLVATAQVQFWHLYVQVALQAGIESVDASVRQALFPRLVPRQHLSDAVTLTATAGRTAGLVGPALGGIAIAELGLAAPFFLSAAVFPLLSAAVLVMRGVHGGSTRTPFSFSTELMEGLRYIMTTPLVRGLLTLEFVFGVLGMNPVTITIVGRQVLGVGPEGLGGLVSAPALGSLAGIAGLLILGHNRRQGRFVFLCTFAYAAALVAFAASQNYMISFATLVLIGLFDVLATVTRFSVMQLAAPGHMRGRVVGNWATVHRGAGPIAQTQGGILAGAIGGPFAVAGTAGALVIAAFTIARTTPALWRLSRDDSIRQSIGPALAESPAFRRDD